MRVDIAGDHHRIRRAGIGQRLQQLLPLEGIAVPDVHRPELLAVVADGTQAGHHDLLRQHVPARIGAAEAVEQPLFLGLAEQRTRGIPMLGATRPAAVAAGLIAAILPRVEHAHLQQIAEAQAPVNRHVRTLPAHRQAHGHEFVPGLIRGAAADQQLFRSLLVFGDHRRVIVVHFMIVPGHRPGGRGVGGLQVGVRAIGLVTRAIVRQGPDFRPLVAPHQILSPGTFVDVVAQMDDEVELLVGHVPIGGVKAMLVLLAGGEGEAETADIGGAGGGSARAAHGAGNATDAPAIEIFRAGPQAAHIGVGGMAEFRRRGHAAAPLNARKSGIGGDFVIDSQDIHVKTCLAQHGRVEPRPEDRRIGPGIARGHAEIKRIFRQIVDPAGGAMGQRRQGAKDKRRVQAG